MAEHMQIWLNLKTSIQLHWTGKKVLPQLNWISLMYARYWTQKVFNFTQEGCGGCVTAIPRLKEKAETWR